MVADKLNFRPDELARAMDVSVDTVRRWINSGQVKHIRTPGEIRIPRSEFIRILSGGLTGKKAPKLHL
jgi:excisionase family DNA binding protein